MSFSAATRNRASAVDASLEREMQINEWARQAVIAYRNLEHWPESEAEAALAYAMAQLGKVLDEYYQELRYAGRQGIRR